MFDEADQQKDTAVGATAPNSLTNGRIDLLGVAISDTNPDDVVRTVEYWIEAGASNYVCFTPVSGVMAGHRDPAARAALNGAGVTAPDGMPVVWASRAAGARQSNRVYGPDLMARLCAEAPARAWSSYFYGGREGVAAEVATRMRKAHPGFDVAGAQCPPFREISDTELDAVANEIEASGAKLVWVGISTPKQDLLMARLVDRLAGPVVLFGVGAAFDIHAGLQRQPPGWLGPMGLFWLYRLLQEPRRLGRRYLVDIPEFLLAVVRRRPFKLEARRVDREDDGTPSSR